MKLSNDRSGARNLDDALGSLTVKCAAPMDDAHFDILLKALHNRHSQARYKCRGDMRGAPAGVRAASSS